MAWSKGLRVAADGTGVVSHVGAVLLRMLADRAGLTTALSAGLARRDCWPVHDRGRVLVGLAGWRSTSMSQIASPPPAINSGYHGMAGARRDRCGATATHHRGAGEGGARMWQLFGGPPAARAAGREIGTGVVVLDVDSTLLVARSDKEGAAPTYKAHLRVPSDPGDLRQHRRTAGDPAAAG
jgi:hypothetical protein